MFYFVKERVLLGLRYTLADILGSFSLIFNPLFKYGKLKSVAR